MSTKRKIGLLLVMSVLAPWTGVTGAAEPGPGTEIGRTPPRLSFTDGQVSFWRPGAEDWAPAQVNTPLASGDELYTGAPGNLEVQIGSQAFLRAWADTQLGLGNQDDAFVQFKVTAGHIALDIRALELGRTVEIGTPAAAFTVDRPGYYRVDVDGSRMALTVRRAGAALVTGAGGQAFSVVAGQEIVVEGTGRPVVASALPPDAWDQWNEARTDRLIEAASARFVAPGVYGVNDLDRYGAWRSVPRYGPVWIPAGVPAGWAPYSTGAWTLDPYYGWTWVDTAPWGWAPYHYGRWVFVDGYWAWAPGPVPVRAVYAPALVAFFGGPVVVGGRAPVGWVALAWGEPLIPWWGRPGFVSVPWWGGWGGPRVVNNVVVTQTTVVNVQHINVYRNAGVQHAVVVVDRDRFGHGPITGLRDAGVDVKTLRPTHAAPQVVAVPASNVPAAGHGGRPPEKDVTRPVVTHAPPVSPAENKRRPTRPAIIGPADPIVSPPRAPMAVQDPARPVPGQKKQLQAPRPIVTGPATPASGKKLQVETPVRGGQGTRPSQAGVGAIQPRPPAPAPSVLQTPPVPDHRVPAGASAAPVPPGPERVGQGKAKLNGYPAVRYRAEPISAPSRALPGGGPLGPRSVEIKQDRAAERPAPLREQGPNPGSRAKDRRNG